MKKSIDLAPEMRFEVYSKLSAILPDSGLDARDAKSGRSISGASKRLLISLVACSLFVCYGLSSVDLRSVTNTLTPELITSHSNPGQPGSGSSLGPISHPKASTVKAGYDRSESRSKLIMGPKPKAIYFKGEYYYGKQCTFSPPGSWAMARTENFKVNEVVRASNEIRDRLKNSCIGVRLLSHLRSAPEKLRAGETYTLRLVPSDKTWTAIEQGDFIFVGGDELEVIESIPD